jgi:predicted nucleotidyltransferase
MKSLPEILSVLRANKERLQAKYPIKSIGVFGSVARNESNPNSDVDVLVDVAPEIGLGFIDLAEELEKLLSEKVDLVSKRAIKPSYTSIIERDIVYV